VTAHFVKFGDPSVARYNVYAGPSREPTTLVGSTPENSFVLQLDPFEIVYVRVTAEDSTGAESPYSNEEQIIGPVPIDAPVVGSAVTGTFLGQGRPNPFVRSTSVPFALAERGAVELTVHDVQGRLVRRLLGGVVDEGPGRTVWDGTDGAGRRVGAGVYFVRMKTAGFVATGKMVRIR
jgi:hypothetical protein